MKKSQLFSIEWSFYRKKSVWETSVPPLQNLKRATCTNIHQKALNYMQITATVLSAWFECKISDVFLRYCISLIKVMSFTITHDFKIYQEKLSFQTNLPNLILSRHQQILRLTVWPSPLVNWPWKGNLYSPRKNTLVCLVILK